MWERVIYRLQLHPNLERFRARTPYFLVTGLIALALLIPSSAIVVAAQAMGYHGTPEVSLTQTWTTILLFPPAVTAFFALNAVLGWVSGYRPFRHEWSDRSLSDARRLSDALRSAAQEMGFTIAWSDMAGGAFVAVRGMEMERSEAFHSGTKFPMRLALFITPTSPGRCSTALKLENRTLVVWDTGERKTCHAVGAHLLEIACADDPALPAFRQR